MKCRTPYGNTTSLRLLAQYLFLRQLYPYPASAPISPSGPQLTPKASRWRRPRMGPAPIGFMLGFSASRLGIPLNDDAPTRKPPDMDAIGARASTACAPRSEGARGRPRQLSGVSGNCRVRYPTKESLCHKASLASSGLSGRSQRWWYAAPTKGGEASFS